MLSQARQLRRPRLLPLPPLQSCPRWRTSKSRISPPQLHLPQPVVALLMMMTTTTTICVSFAGRTRSTQSCWYGVSDAADVLTSSEGMRPSMRVPQLFRGYGSGQTLSDLQGNGCKSGAHLRCPLILARVFFMSVYTIFIAPVLDSKRRSGKKRRARLDESNT